MLEIEKVERVNNLKRLRGHRINLRKNSTKAENILWSYLSNSKLHNKKFRRQHSFYNYILDFYCAEEKMAIELNGEIHNEGNRPEYDAVRDRFLSGCGIKIIRFTNHQVESDVENVLKQVGKLLNKCKLVEGTCSSPAKGRMGGV